MMVLSSITKIVMIVTTVTGLISLVNSQGDPNQPKACHLPGDLVFVLDESGSIWGPDFKRQLDFVQMVADTFEVASNKTRIGVETFGSETRIIFHLDQYQTRNEVKAAIREIVQQRGGTRTDIALAKMRQEMLSRQRTRQWATQVAIVITDGESEYPDLTAEQSRLAHEAGVQMLAIGVGRSVVRAELNQIASGPDLVFMADNYAALDKLRNQLAWKACEVLTSTTTTTTTTTTPSPPMMIEGCGGYKPLDLVWSFPSQAGPDDTDSALQFVLDVSKQLEIGASRVQVALAPRFCRDDVSAIRLKDHDTVQGFESALNDRRLADTAGNKEQIEYIRTQGFLPKNGGRNQAVKMGVVIIDNKSTSEDDTRSEALRAKQSGVKLIVIAVGGRVDIDQAKALAASDSDAFYVQSYGQLKTLQAKLKQRFCAGIMSSSRRGFEMLDD